MSDKTFVRFTVLLVHVLQRSLPQLPKPQLDRALAYADHVAYLLRRTRTGTASSLRGKFRYCILPTKKQEILLLGTRKSTKMTKMAGVTPAK